MEVSEGIFTRRTQHALWPVALAHGCLRKLVSVLVARARVRLPPARNKCNNNYRWETKRKEENFIQRVTTPRDMRDRRDRSHVDCTQLSNAQTHLLAVVRTCVVARAHGDIF